ncbi:MAG: hypothetical protein UR30_C0005G0011 [Candidatus Peregrinibacteria bacterium GW2011_GWC2_33_13]|nr:MAG: hypothetical protein UR30_C0005G0011 [Candidatus Peregrinibacteria bacterium GW2011_GWC2_33_13]
MIEIKGNSGTNYKLQGYFETPSELEPYQGVYIVYDKYNGNYKPIDIGESGDIKTRISSHDRKQDWHKMAKGSICYAIKYLKDCDIRARKEVEQDLRTKFEEGRLCGGR